MNNNKFCAEVIQSSLEGWIAQSWDWKVFPSFGSIVVIEGKKRKLFGVVHQIHSGSMDPVRSPITYQKTEEELLSEQPQIFEFLKTNFSCLILGYEENDSVFHMLAPEPPKIHDFVRLATLQEIALFFNEVSYLQVLFGQVNKVNNIDELLLAMLCNLIEFKTLNKEHFEKFIDTYSLLNNNDYHRLRLFLQRVNAVIQI